MDRFAGIRADLREEAKAAAMDADRAFKDAARSEFWLTTLGEYATIRVAEAETRMNEALRMGELNKAARIAASLEILREVESGEFVKNAGRWAVNEVLGRYRRLGNATDRPNHAAP
ncbi:MAG: hypothetical protein ABFD89_04780 [Bryobacteraceae bacterium]